MAKRRTIRKKASPSGKTRHDSEIRRAKRAVSAASTHSPQLERAIRRLIPEKFEKMIVFLAYTNLDRTNNHVERGNRSFRMLQKTRYRRRLRRTILLALELHVLRRWRKHSLYHARMTRPKRLRRRVQRPRTAYRRAS